MSDAAPRRPAFISSVIYKDNRAALAWLERAFGFEPSYILVDDKDQIVHAEMSWGDGVVMVGKEWADWTRSPADLGGANTQRIHVRIEKDIDGHCARAKAAGATIMAEPSDQFYGDRTYAAIDLEGHRWTFAQTVREATDADYAKVGFKLKPTP
jgi:uncharacterized glyoxalase superfamily protein PhnB